MKIGDFALLAETGRTPLGFDLAPTVRAVVIEFFAVTYSKQALASGSSFHDVKLAFVRDYYRDESGKMRSRQVRCDIAQLIPLNSLEFATEAHVSNRADMRNNAAA